MTNLIVPYDTSWKIEFENLKSTLTRILGNKDIDIQHVGSTAIPDLVAKPILDIDIIIRSRDLIVEVSQILEAVGYLGHGEQGVPGRFAFRQSTDHTPKSQNNRKWQTHHLYVCFSDSLALKNHLLFRNALLNDHNLVMKYAKLKNDLINEKGMTRELYTIRKTDFIIEVLTTHGLNAKEIDEISKANR